MHLSHVTSTDSQKTFFFFFLYFSRLCLEQLLRLCWCEDKLFSVISTLTYTLCMLDWSRDKRNKSKTTGKNYIHTSPKAIRRNSKCPNQEGFGTKLVEVCLLWHSTRKLIVQIMFIGLACSNTLKIPNKLWDNSLNQGSRQYHLKSSIFIAM